MKTLENRNLDVNEQHKTNVINLSIQLKNATKDQYGVGMINNGTVAQTLENAHEISHRKLSPT
jgi:hypothetical protein